MAIRNDSFKFPGFQFRAEEVQPPLETRNMKLETDFPRMQTK